MDLDPILIKQEPDGVIRVKGTRVRFDTVVTAFNLGATAEEIVQQYPSLKLADVYAAISYYLNNRSDVDAYLNKRKVQAKKVRETNESKFDPSGIRERLLSRREEKKDSHL